MPNPAVDRLSEAGLRTYQRLSALSDTDLTAVLERESSTAIAAVCLDLLARLDGYKKTIERLTEPATRKTRDGDPSTSAEAAEHAAKKHGASATVRRNTHKHRLLWVFTHGPANAGLAANRANIDQRSCPWHRVGDLAEAGYLELTGAETNDPHTGRHRQEYRITLSGQEKLRALGPPTATVE